jgi:hypothetical protein
MYNGIFERKKYVDGKVGMIVTCNRHSTRLGWKNCRHPVVVVAVAAVADAVAAVVLRQPQLCWP